MDSLARFGGIACSIVLPKSWFVEPICKLSPVRMVQVCRALSVAMGC